MQIGFICSLTFASLKCQTAGAQGCSRVALLKKNKNVQQGVLLIFKKFKMCNKDSMDFKTVYLALEQFMGLEMDFWNWQFLTLQGVSRIFKIVISEDKA